MTDARGTQQYAEVVEDDAVADARVVQQHTEAVQHEGPSEARTFQQYVEVIYIPREGCQLLETDDVLLVDATYQDVTVTLMDPAPLLAHIYRIKRIDDSSNTVTLDPGSILIDGLPSIDLSPWESVSLVTTGSEWYIIRQTTP